MGLHMGASSRSANTRPELLDFMALAHALSARPECDDRNPRCPSPSARREEFEAQAVRPLRAAIVRPRASRAWWRSSHASPPAQWPRLRWPARPGGSSCNLSGEFRALPRPAILVGPTLPCPTHKAAPFRMAVTAGPCSTALNTYVDFHGDLLPIDQGARRVAGFRSFSQPRVARCRGGSPRVS